MGCRQSILQPECPWESQQCERMQAHDCTGLTDSACCREWGLWACDAWTFCRGVLWRKGRALKALYVCRILQGTQLKRPADQLWNAKLWPALQWACFEKDVWVELFEVSTTEGEGVCHGLGQMTRCVS